MAEKTVTTIDHDKIQAWAVPHGGRPAVMEDAVDGEGRPVLRFAFKDDSEGLKEIGWDEFFRHFDDGRLAMEYADGTPHHEYRLVSRVEAEVDTP